MTAEIAVINKSAIALAADSKVTLSIEGKQKTYDTVNKLFSLSKTEPVGAMIYGNAEFMGFPWETILKEYRRRSPHKKFDTVFDWADNLLEFLRNFFAFPSSDSTELARQIAKSALSEIVSRYFEFVRANLSDDDAIEQLRAEISMHIADLETYPDFLSEGDWAALDQEYADAIEAVAAGGLAQKYETLLPELRRLAELAVRKNRPSPTHTGLVVAGFGDKELLPSLVCYEVDGIIAGRLKHSKAGEIDVTRKNTGAIVPFAQTDMVHRFMEGIDPDYAVQLQDNLHALLLRNTQDVAAAFVKDEDELHRIMPALEAAAEAAFETFWQEDKATRKERFAQPIIDMAMSLPKDELANLAESLVSLTSLQRRVSREIETVGGAIDVAVISKGDGFVWVKRKHYFSPDRNLRFVNGYFSEYATAKVEGD
ncbi:hypothetical protein [Agrobacterium pusense]|uniref:hypothetical protein n=1 Tax=Agrobacterium pusense TaxID=648995 RepID=UPI001571E05A|nr:hypothetical protein [Agrobacterium pusense]NTE46864.1 hypothetical protein [Agrobacterium pusense]